MSKAADLWWTGSTTGPDPLRDPIAFIRHEHDRQFELCSALEDLVGALELEPVAEWAASFLDFLSRDLPLHIDDEELSLFPILAARHGSESELGVILEQLASEHDTDRGLADLIVEDLEVIAKGESPSQPARFFMNVRAFCETQRRHLNWENRIVIPWAETLLTEADKVDLGRKMAARRSGPHAAQS